MASLYALLVGIDEYAEPLTPLRGAGNDIRHAETYLRTHVGQADHFEPLTLLDGRATRKAVIDGFRRHLGRAGPGDTALFWFSGHGSRAPVPLELRWLEPDGMLQTVVCADSRTGDVPDLLDKEISLLLAEVAAAGAHVAVVLDCCYSDGATRDGTALSTLSARGAPELDVPPPIGALLPELLTRGTRDGRPTYGPATHVLLAACDINQRAREVPVPDGHRGVFSLALLDQLARLGSSATYRSLAVAARCQVEDAVWRQHPTLTPITDAVVDQPFLGGTLRDGTSGVTLRFVRQAWQVDVGSCHGVVEGTSADPVEFGVVGSGPTRTLRVVEVEADRSLVVPVGWAPDPARQYPVVLTGVPMPATTVALDVDPGTTARITSALNTAGSGGGPSPHVRVTGLDERTGAPDLRVVVVRPGVVQVRSADHVPLLPARPLDTLADAARVVADVEHIARWRQIKALANPLSRLKGKVRIEVTTVSGRTLWPAATGSLRVEYEDPTTPPEVVVKLHNTHDRELFCVLLDLTDRFRVHPSLLPGVWVAPRYPALAANGDPIRLSLPPGRDVVPGASCRDWLKLLVSEQRFSSLPFHLPRVGEPETEQAHRSAHALTGVVDRLGLTALHRVPSRRPPDACDWTTGIVSIVTAVPGHRGAR